ncbi:MAG: hypothetical protein ACPGU1_00335 [Myxococcota bacterium]
MPPTARPHRLWILMVAAMMVTAQGCGDGPDIGHLNNTGGATGETGHAHIPHSTAGSSTSTAGAAPLGDAYEPGLQKEDAGLTVTLSLSTPEPKYVGKYTWRLSLSASLGEETLPVGWADVVATPTMPSHGHGTFPPTTLGARISEGDYELLEMDLFMPGVWQIDVTVTWEDPFGRWEAWQESEVIFEFYLQG